MQLKTLCFALLFSIALANGANCFLYVIKACFFAGFFTSFGLHLTRDMKFHQNALAQRSTRLLK